jgi:hypothetical protein
MNSNIVVNLPLAQKRRLSGLALRYGLSLPEFSRRVLELLATEIPEESLREYENSEALRRSLARALRDWKQGRVYDRL